MGLGWQLVSFALFGPGAHVLLSCQIKQQSGMPYTSF